MQRNTSAVAALRLPASASRSPSASAEVCVVLLTVLPSVCWCWCCPSIAIDRHLSSSTRGPTHVCWCWCCCWSTSFQLSTKRYGMVQVYPSVCSRAPRARFAGTTPNSHNLWAEGVACIEGSRCRRDRLSSLRRRHGTRDRIRIFGRRLRARARVDVVGNRQSNSAFVIARPYMHVGYIVSPNCKMSEGASDFKSRHQRSGFLWKLPMSE